MTLMQGLSSATASWYTWPVALDRLSSTFAVSLLNNNNKAMIHHTLRFRRPCTEDSLSIGAPSSWTGRSQCHAAGVLSRPQHCSETVLIASHRHSAHYRKIWRHPQNRKYITYYNAARSGSNHGLRQHAQKICSLQYAYSFSLPGTD